jgi:hypothetical protein
MIHSAIPVISVADSSKAEDYYCNILGFKKMFAYRLDPNDYCWLTPRAIKLRRRLAVMRTNDATHHTKSAARKQPRRVYALWDFRSLHQTHTIETGREIGGSAAVDIVRHAADHQNVRTDIGEGIA